MTKMQRFPFTRKLVNATGLHVQHVQRPNDYRFLGWTSWKSRFNSALILQKKQLFVQKSWGTCITTLNKQTRSFFMRIEIKMLVILRMLFAYMSPESIRTHECSRISILFYVILNSLLRIFIPCFLQFSFGLLCRSLLILKNDCYLLKMLLSDLEAWPRYIWDIWSDQVNYR